MLCKSVSQAFFHSLLLFMACAVPLLAPPPESYAYDTLSSDAIDAIKKTHALEAQLKQDSLATPANAAANKEKIAALTQARAELSRVYSTPLFFFIYDTSGASNEFDWIQNSRKTLASSISENELANFDPARLRAATSASVTAKKEVEKIRLAWLKSKNAELETLQTDIDKAEKTFRETGDATDFLKAQALHQQMLQEFGPLKSVNGLDGSAELAQADLVRATHARAVKIIQDTIDAKLEAGFTADMEKWNTSLAVAKHALAQQEQNVADLKAQAQATKKKC